MGKHSLPEDESFSGELPPAGEKKEPLNEPHEPGDGVGDSSLSPIEVW